MASYPGLPASPTLTNPDMILPYGEYDSTPSPPQHLYRPPSPDSANMQFSIGSAPSLGPITPATPIIYGNGTMLSDIGEVTEAESTPGRSRRLPGPAERRMLKQRQNSPLRSSPTIGYDALMKRAKTGNHQRKISVESTSTVTSEGQAAELFKDFDDGVSVDDSNFQGDDEESVADSYAEKIIASETRRLSRTEETIGRDDDRNSSAALSRRAEEILLNAKKRLNNMEGNLTRARSSLSVTPSNSTSSIHSSSPLSRSTPSPPVNGRRIHPQVGVPPSKHRQLNTSSETPNSSPGHSRVYSENSIVPNMSTSPTLVRSASAAARYVGRAKCSPENAREESVTSPLSRTSPPLHITLEPLGEDEDAQEFEAGPGSGRSSVDGGYISPGGNHHGLTRSTSSMQMRDLRGQMHDLKGRLSVLRDRARDDTMKRRSLQSLRTPSPFTAAEQWYAGAIGYGEGNLSADAVVPIPPWKEDQNGAAAIAKDVKPETTQTADLQQPERACSEVTSVYEDVSEGDGHSVVNGSAHQVRAAEVEAAEEGREDEEEENNYDTAAEEDVQKEHYEYEDEYNDEIVDRKEAEDYESNASLYHDSLANPISHEDREDAFDYEHFFLHSAMGTISQQRHGRRDSVGSFSSEDSVETTRGPTAPTATQRPTNDSSERTALGHMRSDSNASMSSLATFATATEGFGSEDEDDEDDDNFAVQQINPPDPRSNSLLVAAKRSTFGTTIKNGIPNDRQPTLEETSRPSSVIHDRGGNNGHIRRPSNPSYDSQESTGTTRSFPLVNKPKSVPSPNRSGTRNGEEQNPVLSHSLALTDGTDSRDRLQPSPVHMLAKDDQALIELLVASVGKCVLGLQEAEPSSYNARVWRRRLDAARRVLEGQEGSI